MLRRNHVARVINSWEARPPMDEQVELAGAMDTADFGVARLLLKPGRRYQEAVRMFSPYETLREPCESVRRGAAFLARHKRSIKPASKTFIYVNNRLEGNALETIQSLAAEILGAQ